MNNDNTVRSTPEEEAAGSKQALSMIIGALIATHSDRKLLKAVLASMAAQNRQRTFDEADAVCFIRDAYDKGIATYLGIIDGADKFDGELTAKRASNEPAANQDGADAA